MIIRDILEEEAYSNAKVIAGKKGISNKITSISVLEVADEKIGTWVLEDQLYITSFYAIIHDIEEQKLVIETLHKNKAAGLVICHLDLFLKEINSEIKILCDELNFPLIIVDSNKSYIEILNPILLKLKEKETNKKYKNLINMQDKLIRYISTKGDLEYIYRTMSKEFGKKIFFLDVNHKILYPKYYPTDKIPLTIKKYYPNILEEANFNTQEYILVKDSTLQLLVYPIQTSGLQYGSIVAEYTEENDINEIINLLRSMASICTLIFTQTSRIREQEVIRKQEYISDLITWNFRNDEIAINRGHEVNWNIINKSRLLLINLNDLHLSSEKDIINFGKFINEILYNGIKNLIKDFNENNLIGLRSDTFIILLELDNDDNYEISKEIGYAILDYCLNTFKGSVSIGISAYIKHYRDIPLAYIQAMDAAKMGRYYIRENIVTMFDDLGFYGIFRDFQKSEDFKKIRNKMINKFKEYDEENKMDLYSTLKALIYNNMSTEKTSAALFLHKNSINYRKKKIVEVLGYEPWNMPHLLNTIICITSEYFD